MNAFLLWKAFFLKKCLHTVRKVVFLHSPKREKFFKVK